METYENMYAALAASPHFSSSEPADVSVLHQEILLALEYRRIWEKV